MRRRGSASHAFTHRAQAVRGVNPKLRVSWHDSIGTCSSLLLLFYCFSCVGLRGSAGHPKWCSALHPLASSHGRTCTARHTTRVCRRLCRRRGEESGARHTLSGLYLVLGGEWVSRPRRQPHPGSLGSGEGSEKPPGCTGSAARHLTLLTAPSPLPRVAQIKASNRETGTRPPHQWRLRERGRENGQAKRWNQKRAHRGHVPPRHTTARASARRQAKKGGQTITRETWHAEVNTEGCGVTAGRRTRVARVIGDRPHCVGGSHSDAVGR